MDTLTRIPIHFNQITAKVYKSTTDIVMSVDVKGKYCKNVQGFFSDQENNNLVQRHFIFSL